MSASKLTLMLEAAVGALLCCGTGAEPTRMPTIPEDGHDHFKSALFLTIMTLLIVAEWNHGKYVKAFVHSFMAKFRPRKNKSGKVARTFPTQVESAEMNLSVKISAYSGIARLIIEGFIRECVVYICAKVLRDPDCIRQVNRERWTRGSLDFYLQHIYKPNQDLFARPIASAPDNCVDVVKRTRSGGHMFSPIRDFHLTDEVQKCVNLASYNYLGFGCVDEICTPFTWKAFETYGFSAAGARTEGGTLPIHKELEREVATFLGKDDAVCIGMGFATNSTILPALLEAKAGGSGVLVLSDALNHRSIAEGVRLSGATVRSFHHNDMDHLEAELKRATTEGQSNGKPWRKVFICVEGIYSMEGDFCPLRTIVTLKNRYKAYLYLDEAHSIGAVGPTGRGVSELLGVPTSEIDVMMGTFSKSFGSAGGYVAASQGVCDALRQSAPGCIFASAMPPPIAAQALISLRVIRGDAGEGIGRQKIASIKDNANFFRKGLEAAGWKCLGDVDSPIIPVMFHHAIIMPMFSRMCLERGMAVVSVGSPAVPVLYERVRFCISASHTREQLSRVLKDATELGAKLGVLYEKGVAPAVLADRATKKAEYDHWLRNSPLELRGDATVATTWSPEPLVPEVNAHKSLAAAALKAATTAESPTDLDLRRFDPAAYVAKPLPAAHDAARKTMDKFGFGACGPRGFYGSSLPHLELEATVSEFLKVEAAIVYSASVSVASSVLPAHISPGDHVIIDTEVHLGVRTGLRLCRAEVTWVPHDDVAAIEAALSNANRKPQKNGSPKLKHQRTFVVVEGLCQRTGRVAQLDKLVALKEKYGALLILDECLSIGAMGAHGRGLTEHFDIKPDRVDAILGSFEHSMAGVGGFCAGTRGFVEHQRLAGSGYCFSASSPPMSCSATVATIKDLSSKAGAARLAKVQENAKLLHESLRRLSARTYTPIKLVSSPDSYVQHLRWNDESVDGEAELLAISEQCAASSDVRVQICVPRLGGVEAAFAARIGATPSPPPSLRVCISAGHSADSISTLAAALHSALGAQ